MDSKKIAAIEAQLHEKPWQLRGEIGAHARPVNSLLFEDVNFEQRVKAPTITAQTTEAIEEMIKQRIKDNKFDDPTRKVKPMIPTPSSRQVEVSSEKSKVGLAQLYEQALVDTVAKPTREGPESEVETRLLSLFKKLDALFYHTG